MPHYLEFIYRFELCWYANCWCCEGTAPYALCM